MLRKNFFDTEELAAIVKDYHAAKLAPAEIAMMDYAHKLTLHAHEITRADVDGLRAHGFSDAEILDIALAAAARNFFSKVLDAVGAEPDDEFLQMEPALREALTVGRPFGEP